MKAIIVKDPFKLEITEVPTPRIENPDDVLIKVISGGICGSDIGIYNGSNSLVTYPRIIGHEFGGEVIAVGSAVSNVKVGDKVAVDPVHSCGTCYACTHGRHNVCSTLEVSGVHRDGGFAEYAVAPEKLCYRVDTAKVPEELLFMVEPYSIGMQINTRANIQKGDKVLIMGSGPIGVGAMQIAKSRGAQVMMTDLVDSRLQRALEMGADVAVNVSKEDLKERVMAWTNGEGMPVVVDSVCSLDSPVQAMELACPAGRVVVLGLKAQPSQMPQVHFTKKELDVVGSRLSNHRFPEVIELFENGKVTPAQMMTHSFDFTRADEAVRLIIEHPDQVCKVSLTF